MQAQGNLVAQMMLAVLVETLCMVSVFIADSAAGMVNGCPPGTFEMF